MKEFYRQREPQRTLYARQSQPGDRAGHRADARALEHHAAAVGRLVQVETDLAAGPTRPFSGSESELRDAFTNLVLNAVDAMPEGGTLTLRTFSGATSDRLSSRRTAGGSHRHRHRHGRRRRAAAAWSPSSRPRASAAPGLAWPWSTAWSSATAAELEVESAAGPGYDHATHFSDRRPPAPARRPTHSHSCGRRSPLAFSLLTTTPSF